MVQGRRGGQTAVAIKANIERGISTSLGSPFWSELERSLADFFLSNFAILKYTYTMQQRKKYFGMIWIGPFDNETERFL